jgi:hypothetical protein
MTDGNVCPAPRRRPQSFENARAELQSANAKKGCAGARTLYTIDGKDKTIPNHVILMQFRVQALACPCEIAA